MATRVASDPISTSSSPSPQICSASSHIVSSRSRPSRWSRPPCLSSFRSWSIDPPTCRLQFPSFFLAVLRFFSHSRISVTKSQYHCDGRQHRHRGAGGRVQAAERGLRGAHAAAAGLHRLLGAYLQARARGAAAAARGASLSRSLAFSLSLLLDTNVCNPDANATAERRSGASTRPSRWSVQALRTSRICSSPSCSTSTSWTRRCSRASTRLVPVGIGCACGSDDTQWLVNALCSARSTLSTSRSTRRSACSSTGSSLKPSRCSPRASSGRRSWCRETTATRSASGS